MGKKETVKGGVLRKGGRVVEGLDWMGERMHELNIK
jgi:hypothetical protein